MTNVCEDILGIFVFLFTYLTWTETYIKVNNDDLNYECKLINTIF